MRVAYKIIYIFYCICRKTPLGYILYRARKNVTRGFRAAYIYNIYINIDSRRRRSVIFCCGDVKILIGAISGASETDEKAFRERAIRYGEAFHIYIPTLNT